MAKSSSPSRKSSLERLSPIGDLIRERGPLTVAAFMDLALYDSEHGYYARTAQRSGRAGDFFTSVDVGPIFGELVEAQLAEMAGILHSRFSIPDFDLVEAGAGNGRLAADILRSARAHHPTVYEGLRLHLVEASGNARTAQRATLGETADRLASTGDALPPSFEGVLLANELLDAFPVHQVVMRAEGLREVYVDVSSRGAKAPSSRSAKASSSRRAKASFSRSAKALAERLHLVEGPLSTPALAGYLDQLGVTLEPGWRVEINLRAVDWIRDAARRLRRGFIILIDYGHDARELYSPAHSAGTLTTFARHQSSGPESSPDAPAWLQHPGEQDITAHIDFTSVRAAAEAAGLTTLAFLDQTYFLMGLVSGWSAKALAERARALKTLIMPGGLGSTHKVLILGKDVGTPSLLGCSFKVRVT